MSSRELDVGSLVSIAGFATGHATPEASYRIEQLLRLGDGDTLYKIRNEAEPFDRVVAEGELTDASTLT
jgi:hypothetical protein